MANKRNLKKEIRNICGDLAAELLSAAACIEGFDTERVNDIVGRIASLQVNALSHCTFSFDKTAKDFDNAHDYHKALRAYNRKAFGKLKADADTEIAAILKEMNALLPQAARDAVKAAAKA